MNLSFSTRGWPNLSWDEMIDTALDMGFAGIEVYNLPKFDPMLEKGGPFHKYQTAATVRQLREKKLTIPCFDTSYDLSQDDSCLPWLKNLLEIAGNVVQGRARFLREVERCNRAGCHMIVLIEHGGKIRTLEDVIGWKNPRLKVSPLAVSGERLFKIMKAMESRYGIEWQFCGKQQTGKRIIEILGSDIDAGNG